MSRTDPQMKIRLTPDLKQAIERAAQNNGRSMNAEIIARLEQSLALDLAAEQAMNGNPLKGIVALCEHITNGAQAIATLALQEGIQSGKVRVKDDR